jgi:hypothetical protein
VKVQGRLASIKPNLLKGKRMKPVSFREIVASFTGDVFLVCSSMLVVCSSKNVIYL